MLYVTCFLGISTPQDDKKKGMWKLYVTCIFSVHTSCLRKYNTSNVLGNLLSEKILNLRTYSRPEYRLFVFAHYLFSCLIQLLHVLISSVLEFV